MAQKTAAERIREYKQLLDEGMITQEEFELKKKKILETEDAELNAEAENAKKEGNVFSGHYFSDRSENGGNDGTPRSSNSSISTKATGVLAYLTWIGFLIAYFAGDRQGAKFHLNQGLVLNLFGLLSAIPLIGKIWSIFIFVCMVLGVINASQGMNKELPLIGGIKLL